MSGAMKSLLNFLPDAFDGFLVPEFLSVFQIFFRTWQRPAKSNNFGMNKKYRVFEPWWERKITDDNVQSQKKWSARIWIVQRGSFHVSSWVLFVASCINGTNGPQISSIKLSTIFFAKLKKLKTLPWWRNFSSVRRQLNFKFRGKKHSFELQLSLIYSD